MPTPIFMTTPELARVLPAWFGVRCDGPSDVTGVCRILLVKGSRS